MLDDKYRIDDLLAIGGMGAVYVGTHTKLRKRVAIKVLNPQLSTPAMIERFHREAITASQIGHEGIAQVTDLGTSGAGEPFLVMELLEGEPLSKRLRNTGALPVDVACELGCAILSPLDAAHRAGIVHRDLKPDNVFLVRQSRGEMVKLLDFGISRAAGLEQEFRLTTTGLVLGTPYYMSPEQARGDGEITRAADIYSFAVILYEMLIGQIPITGENYNQLMYKVMMGEYVRPRERRPDIPPELDDVIVAAMSLNPEARPRSAAELEQALLPFCRPTFREYTIERTSAPGFAPIMTPQPLSRSGAPPMVGTDQTVLAPTPPPMQARSKRGLVVALVAIAVIGGGIAAVAIGAGGGGKDEVATAPAPALAPAPVAKPAAPTPAPAPTPAKVTIKLSITPPEAEVEIDGKRAPADELVVDKDDTKHHVHITADGFVAHDEDIKFDESQRLTIELAKQVKAVPTVTKTPTHTQTKKPDKIESKSPYD
jgi:serine/threonine-protein kinase